LLIITSLVPVANWHQVRSTPSTGTIHEYILIVIQHKVATFIQCINKPSPVQDTESELTVYVGDLFTMVTDFGSDAAVPFDVIGKKAN